MSKKDADSERDELTVPHDLSLTDDQIELLISEHEKEVRKALKSGSEALFFRSHSEAHADIVHIARILKNRCDIMGRETERLKQRLDDMRTGLEGCCYACEPVGEINKKLREERDEARREVCNIVAGKQGKRDNYSPDALEHARMRGWDCFGER